MKLKYTCLVAIMMGLAACASTPEPEPEPTPEPVVEAPIQEPEPPRVVEQLPPQIVEPAPDLPIPGSLEDFVYQSGEDRVYFGYDRYDLTPEARDVLRKQAAWLNQYGQVNVVIAGNADERGTREYNLALGARRADTVKSFLVSQGVNPTRLTTVSYGKERPIDPRSNEAGWARNRNAHSNIISGAVG